MSPETASMVDTFLRVAGLAIIAGIVQAACLTVGAVAVVVFVRMTAKKK